MTGDFTHRWLRRSISIPLMAALWAICTLTLPLLLALALFVDLPALRRRLGRRQGLRQSPLSSA